MAFEVGEVVTRYGEWDTCDNPRGEFKAVQAPWGCGVLHVSSVAEDWLPGSLFSVIDKTMSCASKTTDTLSFTKVYSPSRPEPTPPSSQSQAVK